MTSIAKQVWWGHLTAFVDGEPMSKACAERIFWFVRGVEPIDFLARQAIRPEGEDAARRAQERQDAEVRSVATAFLVMCATMFGPLPGIEFRAGVDAVPLDGIDHFDIGRAIRGPHNCDGWFGQIPTIR